MADNAISEPFAHDVQGLVHRVNVMSPVIPRAGVARRAPAVSEARQVMPSGLYSSGQMARWRKVTSALHAKGGRMHMQLWYVGCHAHGHDGEALADVVDDFRIAAAQAIAAGFDGVELHVTNGFLLEQFLKGDAAQLAQGNPFSIEQRARLLLDVAADRKAAARCSFIVGRLGVAYLRVVDGAVNCPRDVTSFDCRLLSALLLVPEPLDRQGTQSEASRCAAARERAEPPATRAMAASGKDRPEPVQVRRRQVAAEIPSSRVEIQRRAVVTA